VKERIWFYDPDHSVTERIACGRRQGALSGADLRGATGRVMPKYHLTFYRFIKYLMALERLAERAHILAAQYHLEPDGIALVPPHALLSGLWTWGGDYLVFCELKRSITNIFIPRFGMNRMICRYTGFLSGVNCAVDSFCVY